MGRPDAYRGVRSRISRSFPESGTGGSKNVKVSIQGTNWLFDGNVLYPGSSAEGLLTNARMVNSVFEDDRETVPEILGRFESDANTDRFISRIPDYAPHGIAAFTISLQGGAPNYEGAVNSAFNVDGTLRGGYLARVARVIEAADTMVARSF